MQIDGRQLPFNIKTADDYLRVVMKLNDEQVEDYYNYRWETIDLITQIISLNLSIHILRRTNHTCQSLPDSLRELRGRLIGELNNKYDVVYEFEGWEE